MNQLLILIRSLVIEEDGAQIIEYALIIAVIAIALVVALRGLVASNLLGFMTRLDGCLLNSTCT